MKSLADRLSNWLGGIAAILIAVLLVAQLAIVAMRYVFAAGWPWAQDLLVYTFMAASLVPGAAVIAANLGVRVDIFYDGWSRHWRRRVDRAALLILLAPATGYAAWAMFGTVVNSWRVLESSPNIGGLPGYFILKTLLFGYFLSISLLALLLCLRRDPYRSDPYQREAGR